MPVATPDTVEQPAETDDEIMHLVCHCQLDEDWNATTRPLVAYCGWVEEELSSKEPKTWAQICSMCIEVVTCPVCGAPKPPLP